ncbi:MAG: DUF2834 domain-containing protein [Lapillicoccus sp.]
MTAPSAVAVDQESRSLRSTVIRQVAYAVAALFGGLATWFFNLRYDGSASYLAAWFANDASSSAAVDLLVVSAVLTVFVFAESRRLQMRAFVPVLFLVSGLLIAMAFAVPAFLLYRERRLARTSASSGG